VCDRNGSGRQEDGWEKCIPACGATAHNITGHRDVDAGAIRGQARIFYANATHCGKFADSRPHNWAEHAHPF
jgi:hypothetical protein